MLAWLNRLETHRIFVLGWAFWGVPVALLLWVNVWEAGFLRLITNRVNALPFNYYLETDVLGYCGSVAIFISGTACISLRGYDGIKSRLLACAFYCIAMLFVYTIIVVSVGRWH